MTDEKSQRYDREEVNRIIRRALVLENGDSIGHHELIETAKEMGISSDRLEAAIEQEQTGKAREEARSRWLKRHRSSFHAHLWSYFIVIGVLMLINVMTPGPWWFQWPMLGWGIGLAFHIRDAYFPTERKIERGTKRMLKRSKRG